MKTNQNKMPTSNGSAALEVWLNLRGHLCSIKYKEQTKEKSLLFFLPIIATD